MYTPPGYEHLADPLGVLVVLDGHAQHSAVTVLDNLHADGRIDLSALGWENGGAGQGGPSDREYP